MRFEIALGLAVMTLMGADTPTNKVKSKGDAFQGTWQLSSGEVDGKVLAETQLKGGELTIKGDRYTVILADIGMVTGVQKLRSSQKLKTIDITDETGPRKGQTCLGIYELNGNEFRVVFAAPDGPRPSEFKTLPDSGQWMHVWNRIQK